MRLTLQRLRRPLELHYGVSEWTYITTTTAGASAHQIIVDTSIVAAAPGPGLLAVGMTGSMDR